MVVVVVVVVVVIVFVVVVFNSLLFPIPPLHCFRPDMHTG